MLFVSSFILQSQNLHWEKWDATALTDIEFHLPFASNISITTSKDKFIRVKYQSEGEYQNDYILKKNWEENRLIVEEISAPQKLDHNDKLSAHKVIATQIRLVLPESISLHLFADETLLLWDGNHTNIHLELTGGKAIIKAEKIQGKIKTSTADVAVFGMNGQVKMICGSGDCDNFHTKEDTKLLEISSRQGNIALNPS